MLPSRQEGVWHLPSRCLSTSCVGPLIKERLWHQYMSHLASCCKLAVLLSLGPGPPDGNRPRNRNTQRRRGPKASRDQPAAAGGGSAAADAATAEGSNAQERRAPPGEQCPSPPLPIPRESSVPKCLAYHHVTVMFVLLYLGRAESMCSFSSSQ